MSSQSTVRHQTSAGAYATSRRGALTSLEIHEIEALRARDRPVPFNALARRYGRCEADIRALFIVPEPKAATEEPWPFGEASEAVQAVVREISRVHRVSLAQMAAPQGGTRVANLPIWKAQRAAYVAAKRVGKLSMTSLEEVFRRDKATLSRAISLHHEMAA